MLGARVFEKHPVVLYGSRRLVGLIVQLGKIVMRGSVPWSTVEDIEQAFLCQVELTEGPFGQREIDSGIQVPRLDLKGRLKLSHGLIRPSQQEQGNAVVVARPRVPWLDGNGSLQFAGGFGEKPLLLVQEAEVVVRLRVELIAFEKGAVALQCVFEITRAMVVNRELQIVVRRHDGRCPLGM